MAASAPQLPEDDIEAAAQQPVPDENAPADGDKSSQSDGYYRGLTYEQHLYEYAHTMRADFQDLSDISIVHLMNELAKYNQSTEKDGAAPQDIEHVGDLLHRYTIAVQDLGYWSGLPRFRGVLPYDALQRIFPGIYRGRGDFNMAHLGGLPRSPTRSIDPLRSFLNKVLPYRLTWSMAEQQRRDFPGTNNSKKLLEVSPFVDTLARFIVAITGGLSLVVPMLVMRLDEHLKKSLITVSVAVILFSALTSLMFKASNVETLAATATYAAVLRVFVGTSS